MSQLIQSQVVEKNPRLIALKSLCEEFHYGRMAKRLSEEEFDRVVQFIEDNSNLAHLEFEYAVNRMHLGIPDKPKHWNMIQEILCACNTRAFGRRRSG